LFKHVPDKLFQVDLSTSYFSKDIGGVVRGVYGPRGEDPIIKEFSNDQ